MSTSFAAGQVVDGVTLAVGDRILIKNQAVFLAASPDNGIYVVNASGAPARAADAASGTDLVNAAVAVQQGTANQGSTWIQTTAPPITIGSTGIFFTRLASRPLHLTVLASNVASAGLLSLPLGQVDFVCSGANDDVVINNAVSLASVFGGTVELSAGTFTIGAPIAMATNVALVGQGANATTVRRASPGTFEMIQINGASGDHIENVRIRDLYLDGGSYNVTNSALQCHYASKVIVERVNTFGVLGHAVDGLEFWDSTFRDCRWDWCGSQGQTGSNVLAAVALAPSAADNSNNIHFTNCTWESYKDGAIAFLGGSGGSNRINKCHFTNCKLESHNVNGTSIRLDWCVDVTFTNLNITLGKPNTSGVFDAFVVTNSTAIAVDGYLAETIDEGGQSVRTLLSLQGGNIDAALEKQFFSVASTNHPSVAALEFTGTNTLVDLGYYAYAFDGSGSSTLVTGLSTLTKRFENEGSVTIPSGSTSATVTHNLRRAPTAGEIVVTLQNKPTNDPGSLNVDTITGSTFVVRCRNNPGTSGAIIGWAARTP